jgi:PKD repeat protein
MSKGKHLFRLFCCSMSVLCLMLCGTVFAQDEEPVVPTVAQIDLRAVSPNDITEEGFTTNSSTGLPVVGVGTTVYLQGSGTTAEEKTITGYAWTIAGPRLSTTADTMNTTFTPPTQGLYSVSLVVTDSEGGASEAATQAITAAKWEGIRNCAGCHSGQYDTLVDKVTPWSQTGHARALAENLDRGSAHFSENCISCHTVGFDPDAENRGFDDIQEITGWTFPETKEPGNWDALVSAYPNLANKANVQCESCHGPGSLHYGDPERTAVTLDSGVCASCHDSGSYHTKNYEWDTSGHADQYYRGSSGCVACHSGVGFVQTYDPDYAGQPVSTEFGPISCSVCHDPHSAENPHQVRVMEDVVLNNGVVVTAEEAGTGILCYNCHKSRRDVRTYVMQYANHYGPHYSPQGDVLAGTGGYEFEGINYTKVAAHLEPMENACVDCHMAAAPTDAPLNAVGRHTFRMQLAADPDDSDPVVGSTEEIMNMNACTRCHDNLTTLNRTAAGDYDGNGAVEGIQDEVHGLLAALGMYLPPLGAEEVEITADYTAIQLKAGYNYKLVEEDQSMGVHNPQYLVQILQSSYLALTGTNVPNADITFTGTITVPTEIPEPTPEPTSVPENAPIASASLVSISPRDIEEGLATDGTATGMPIVGIGTTVYLQGSGTDAAGEAVASYQWTFTGPSLSATSDVQNPTFAPPVEGIYTAALVVTDTAGVSSAPVSIEITSAMWMGKRNCASCHSGGFGGLTDKVTGWSATGHATILAENLDHGPAYYGESSISFHTVGYDPNADNGGFDDVAAESGWVFPVTKEEGNWAALEQDYPELANLSNIQCESCHGPGSLHYGDPARTSVMLDSGVCATCHDAGSHHIKNYEWDTSGHADQYYRGSSGCVACHSGIGFVQTYDPDYAGQEVSTEFGAISCAVCHDPHSAENPHQIRVMEDLTLQNGVVATLAKVGKGALCANCHHARRDVRAYVLQYANHFGPHYSPQVDVLIGTGGHEYPGITYSSFQVHSGPINQDSCITCHLAEPFEGAPANSVGGHTFRITQTVENEDGTTSELFNTNACSSCHAGLDTVNRTAKGDYDGNGAIEGIQDEVHGLLNILAMYLPPLDSTDVVITADYTAEQLKAAYNYMLVEEDQSMGIHNPKYEVQLLQSSILAISGDEVPNADIAYTGTIVVPTPTQPEEPEPTATPTVTPVPQPAKALIVTDNAMASVDLSNGVDRDCDFSVQLSVAWDLAQFEGIDTADAGDVHLYVSVDGADYEFLSVVASSEGSFEWKAGAYTAMQFAGGPTLGKAYQFAAYVLSVSGDPFFWGPVTTEGPVQLLTLVSVTDDVSSTADLSGGQDADTDEERGLALKWEYDSDAMNVADIAEVHIYVKKASEITYSYLGKSSSQSFVWESGSANTAPAFADGPQFGESYSFIIYALTTSGTPHHYGFCSTLGAVEMVQL